MSRTKQAADTPFLRACNGRLMGVLQWHDLDSLWAQLQRRNDGQWYVYAIGEPPPAAPSAPAQFADSLAEIRRRLRDEHKEEYCGIVYADDHADPAFVKIYDPGNLGAVCGFSENPPLPGWTLSRVTPEDLTRASSAPRVGQRWWRRIFR